MRNKWTETIVKTPDDALRMYEDYVSDFELIDDGKPLFAGFDTESTGLHIKKDKAFLVQFGWLSPSGQHKVYVFEPSKEIMSTMYFIAEKFKFVFAWNTKFDLHMLRNAGYPYPHNNLADGMFLGRLTTEALSKAAGGEALGLKPMARKYLSKDAVKDETAVKNEIRALKQIRINKLKLALKDLGVPDKKFMKSGKEKFWTKGMIEKFLKDPTHDIEDLPKKVQKVWTEWLKDNPEPTYADVDRDLMISYAANDVILLLELVSKMYPVAVARNQLKTFELENKAILPLYRMESVGFNMDLDYLYEAKKQIKEYIRQQRNEMYKLIGGVINVGQHQAIRNVFATRFGIGIDGANNEILTRIAGSSGVSTEGRRYATLITELRTLEKWYSTYVCRLIDLTIASGDGRSYTQIKQASAVSGRVGSDFQQFPKKPLKTEHGRILFHPRRPFITTGRGYDTIWYLDYSQIELRVQANYTIKVSGGDTNLCRAYMPYKCTNVEGVMYDPRHHKHRWNTERWYMGGTTDLWRPTDVHSATTHTAFPNIPIDSDEFKVLRGSGKAVNFAKNYGAEVERLKLMLPDVDPAIVEALDAGYHAAFPGVKKYQEAVMKAHLRKGFVTNEYGRRYYLTNSRDAYKLCNYLVQGTAADMLKSKIIEIDEFLLKFQSRFQMNIHDELSFEIWNGEEQEVIPGLKKIMEDFDWIQVPVVADIEVTFTNWAEKEEIELGAINNANKTWREARDKHSKPS